MKKAIVIATFLAIALVMSTPCHAVEPEIVITNVYTCDYLGQPCTEFRAWEVVYYYIDYTIYGVADRLYKVIGITHAFGMRTEEIEKLPPGDYTMTAGRVFGDDVEPGVYEADHKLKLKKKGILVDVDTATTPITVVE